MIDPLEGSPDGRDRPPAPEAGAPAVAGSAVPDLGLVSLVVPAYNERDNIRPLIEAIEAGMQGARAFEIVMVDDGSTDGTRQVLVEEMALRPHLRVVALDRNHGQTAAFDAGFRAARGDVIVTMDADLQNDPRDIPRLLDALEGADAVVGFRQVRRDSFVKRISSRIANGIRNRITRESIRDVGCSLKAFRAEALRAVPLFEGMHRFFPTLLRMRGHQVVEVPVAHHPRCHGQSKYGIRNRVLRSLLDCLAVRWMQWRLLRYSASELEREMAVSSGSEGPGASARPGKPDATANSTGRVEGPAA